MEVYRQRLSAADDAVQAIESGQRVFVTGNCSVPECLLDALVARAPTLTGVELVQVLTFGRAPQVAPELAGHIRVNTLFISDNVRQAVNDGRADFTPCFLSEIPLLFLDRRIPIDVALIHVSPPDDHGFCSFGVEVGVTKAAAQSAKTIIAQLNPNMPRTLGDAFIHVSKLDRIVPVDEPLPEAHMADTSDLAQQIARHIVDLIPDGSTLQTGIGAIPDAVLRQLHDKRHLGIHTELISDGVIDLIERGVIDGEMKTLHPGKIVAGFILGTRRLFDFVHDNPIFEMHPTEYVNDPFIIAHNDRMVAINSAIEVDLTGQVAADSIGPRLYSGVGGQVDFIYGASRSRGGVPIIAQSSTAMIGGTPASKIVATLKPGAGVTTSRNHVHYVVTEHGVAALYAKTIRQRARALIDIAAPEFRAELEQRAIELKYL
jgi:acetyl-CoA hydrolase